MIMMNSSNTTSLCTRRKTKQLGLVLPSLFKDGRIRTKDSRLQERVLTSKQTHLRSAVTAKPSDETGGSEEDLFSSQPSVSVSQSSDVSNAEVRQQLEQNTWVQCDNMNCQKWRRVNSNDTDDIGDAKWFCFMNSDPLHSSCDAPEEDYTMYDRLARKIGLKYVFSELQEGSLVWAKVIGYCRWPAMITKDPVCGSSMDTDQDGDPLFYHVEYLGEPRTHGWVRSDFVTTYGHKDAELSRDTDSCNTATTVTLSDGKRTAKGKNIGKKRGCKRLSTQAPKRQLKTYRKQGVEAAIKEADRMSDWSEGERLKSCVFECLQRSPGKSGADGAFDFVEEREKNNNICLKKITKYSQQKQSKKKLEKGNECNARKKVKLDSNIPRGEATCKHVTDTAQASRTVKEISQPQNPQNCVSDYRKTFCQFNSSLVDKSKEERLTFDVEMYRRNEKAFEHDVRRFMFRQGLKVGPSPVWNNTPVTLFQLFSMVFDEGGYHQVCKQRGWSAVFREVSNHPSSTEGSRAKTFYFRYLLPYEYYLRGQDFEPLLTKAREVKKPRVAVCPSPTVRIENQVEEENDAISEASDYLEAMLASLEESSNLLRFDDEVNLPVQESDTAPLPSAKPPAGVKGLDVLFYDDSPEKMLSPGVKVADTVSEFGIQANLPGGLPLKPVSGGTGQLSDRSSDVDGAEQLLQELHNVEHQIDLLQNQFMIEE